MCTREPSMCIAEKKRKERKINSVPQFADNVLLNLKEIKVLFLLDGSSVSV